MLFQWMMLCLDQREKTWWVPARQVAGSGIVLRRIYHIHLLLIASLATFETGKLA